MAVKIRKKLAQEAWLRCVFHPLLFFWLEWLGVKCLTLCHETSVSHHCLLPSINHIITNVMAVFISLILYITKYLLSASITVFLHALSNTRTPAVSVLTYHQGTFSDIPFVIWYSVRHQLTLLLIRLKSTSALKCSHFFSHFLALKFLQVSIFRFCVLRPNPHLVNVFSKYQYFFCIHLLWSSTPSFASFPSFIQLFGIDFKDLFAYWTVFLTSVLCVLMTTKVIYYFVAYLWQINHLWYEHLN